MKLFLKITLTSAAALMLVGGIIWGIAVARGGVSWRVWDTNYEASYFTRQFDAVNVQNLTVDTVGHTVEFVRAEDDSVTIKGQNNARNYYDIEIVDGTLRIVYRSRYQGIFGRWFNWGDWGSGTLLISLPTGLQMGKVQVSNVSGDILWNECPTDMDSCALESVSGKVQVSDLTTNANLSATSVSGRILIDQCQAGGDFRAETMSGSIQIASAGSVGDFRANSVSGKISVTSAQASHINIENVSGNIELQAIHFASLNCESVSGAISASVSEAEYHVVFSTVSGKINSAFGNLETADITIRMETVSGNITLTRD